MTHKTSAFCVICETESELDTDRRPLYVGGAYVCNHCMELDQVERQYLQAERDQNFQLCHKLATKLRELRKGGHK